MQNRFIFPVFNALVGVVLGLLIGYYVFYPELGILVGGAAGLSIGIIAEFLLSRLGRVHWIYQRRVLLSGLLEMLLAVFGVGPLAYTMVGTAPDHHTICCETPLDYGATRYEDFRLATNGVTLAGWYVPPHETPGPVIVLLHGARGDRRGTAWYARQFIQAGYGVLLYDRRALGESTGEKVSDGWLDGPDLVTVIENLATRSDVDPKRIGAVGLSGGGHAALNAAYLAPDRIYALWIDGIEAQRIEDFPPAGNFGEQFATFLNDLILRDSELYLGGQAPPAIVEILAKLDHPKTMIVASKQEDFEYRVSQKYAKVAQANTQVWVIEQAGHVGGPAVIPDEYKRRMLEFFGSP